jgi:hypothetical protein
METIRREVHALVLTTERLLSPITLGQSLNEDEREIVAMCAESLAEKYPRAVPSVQESWRSEKEAILDQSRQVTIDSQAVIERTRINIRESKADIGKMKEQMRESRNAGKDALADR